MKEFVSPFPEDNDTPEMRTMLENIDSMRLLLKRWLIGKYD